MTIKRFIYALTPTKDPIRLRRFERHIFSTWAEALAKVTDEKGAWLPGCAIEQHFIGYDAPDKLPEPGEPRHEGVELLIVDRDSGRSQVDNAAIAGLRKQLEGAAQKVSDG